MNKIYLLNNIFHKYSVINTIVKKQFYSILVYLKHTLYPNLIIGKNSVFIGFPKIKNKQGGKIKIGNYCTFLSKSTSNLIGINRPCIISTLKSDARIIIGNNCGFSGTVIGAFEKIEIMDNVRCGANTLITDSDWHLDDPRAGKPAPILIEENVWLGEGVKVLKGVIIGKNTVIGAGSVVTRSIPANVIAAGNPCRIIKNIP